MNRKALLSTALAIGTVASLDLYGSSQNGTYDLRNIQYVNTISSDADGVDVIMFQDNQGGLIELVSDSPQPDLSTANRGEYFNVRVGRKKFQEFQLSDLHFFQKE